MSRQVRRFLTVAALAALVGGGSQVMAAEPSTQDLMTQIQQLQAKVQQLEANQKQQQTQVAQSADQQRAIEDVLKDAQNRSEWMDNSTIMSNYHNGKFILRDEAGNFVFHPWLQFDPRYITTYRQNESGSKDDTQSGFELRRAKFGFDGNVYTPKMKYLLNWATDRHSGVPVLEEGWVRYQFDDNWALQGGQIKGPISHEQMNSSKHLMAVERSYPVDLMLGGDDFTQGVMAIYHAGSWRAYGSFNDGARNNSNQNFQDFPTNNADYGIGGRVEYKITGDWGAYSAASPIGLKNDLLVVGGAADLTQAGDTDFLVHTVDAQYMNTSGLSVYGAYLARSTQHGPPVTGAPSTYDSYTWSLEGQVGYMIDQHWEPYGRYTYTHIDPAELPAGTENDVHAFTAGVNYLWHGDSAKWTADVVYLPNGAPASDSGAGLLANNGNNEVVFRIQFQLLI